MSGVSFMEVGRNSNVTSM